MNNNGVRRANYSYDFMVDVGIRMGGIKIDNWLKEVAPLKET